MIPPCFGLKEAFQLCERQAFGLRFRMNKVFPSAPCDGAFKWWILFYELSAPEILIKRQLPVIVRFSSYSSGPRNVCVFVSGGFGLQHVSGTVMVVDVLALMFKMCMQNINYSFAFMFVQILFITCCLVKH